MKRFIFEVKEYSVGVVEVYANSEDEARELAEEYEGMLQACPTRIILTE